MTAVQIKWMKEDRAGEQDETTTAFVLRVGRTAASSTAAAASAVAAAAKDGAVVVKDGVVSTAQVGCGWVGGQLHQAGSWDPGIGLRGGLGHRVLVEIISVLECP